VRDWQRSPQLHLHHDLAARADPLYVEVIVTGQAAALESTGETYAELAARRSMRPNIARAPTRALASALHDGGNDGCFESLVIFSVLLCTNILP
jgi:hypothetical protein